METTSATRDRNWNLNLGVASKCLMFFNKY
jgi:hypothetical protein